MNESGKAVFLSYASQDTEAARRICDALRVAGVEVWFDQSELRGGDAWDQKIRKQIKECALFVPIVSAHTQTRKEGYFRREWKQAVDRLADIAEGVPFLVPVCVDDTAERSALVPPAFLDVQWTRLPAGAVLPDFVHRVQGLVATETAVAPAALAVPSGRHRSTSQLPASSRRRPGTLLIAAVIALVALAAVWPISRWKTTPAPSAVSATGPSSPLEAATPIDTAKSVAVLPFQNLSADAESGYFAVGLHEEILTALGKVSALRVVGGTSVQRYADLQHRNLREIAADLAVGAVLEASVRPAKGRVRITVKLVETQTGSQMWADGFEGELTDVFSVQSTIAQAVAGRLQATLTLDERALLDRNLTQNADAYRHYIHAMAALRAIGVPWLASRESVEKCITLFQQASAADPSFLLPWVRLAQLHAMMFWFGHFDPSDSRMHEVENAVRRVRQIAPKSPEFHLTNGYLLYMCRRDWDAALAEARLAQAGLPNDPAPLRIQAWALRRLGRVAAALPALERALTFDPEDSLAADSFLESLMMLRRYREAVDRGRELARRIPKLGVTCALAQLAMDRDLPAYVRTLRSLEIQLRDNSLSEVVFDAHLVRRDFTAAEAWVASCGPTTPGMGGIVLNPAARNRALLAFAQGQRQLARDYAKEAQQYFEQTKWTLRQQPMVAAELSLLHAIMGEAALARSAAERGHILLQQQPDFLVDVNVRFLVTLGHVMLGDREEALHGLQRMTTGSLPALTVPFIIERHPLWSPLATDPRFAKIMNAAKPQ